MKKSISFILAILMIASAVMFPSEAYGDSAAYTNLVRHWAPTIYHALNPACNDAKGDFITRFNYDGDWKGNNNWDNLDNYPMQSYVYYAIQETQTHYFIGYYFFHPQDDAEELDADKHENDFEGIILVIRKNGGYGTFELMETQAHNQWYQYTPANSNITSGFDDVDGHVLFDGNRPKVYIQPNGDLWGHGHGVKAYDGSGSPTGYGNVYKYTGTAQVPNMDNNWGNYQYQIGYDLISIDELWNRRYDYKVFEEQGSEERVTFQKFGVFDGNDYGIDAATAPWGWEDPDDGPVGKGMNFSDPAHFVDTHLNGLGEFSHTYVYNPYYTYKLKISEISSQVNRDGFLSGTSDIYPLIFIGNGDSAEKYSLGQLWKKDNAATGTLYSVNWGGYQADDDAEYSANYNSLYIARDISDTVDLRIMDSDSLIFDNLNEDDYMGSIIFNPSITGTATWSRFYTNNTQAKVTLSLEINNKPPVITFNAGGQYGASEVTYVTEGHANASNVPDFNIIAEDLDAIAGSDNITRVEIRRVASNGSESVVKAYNTANRRVILNEDIYGCMNPNGQPFYDAVQTFKVLAYQGSYVYSSRQITVKLLEYYGPNITLSPCKLDPYNTDDEYASPTVEYSSIYYANQITDPEKDPKFYIKVDNNFGQPEGMRNILWIKLMEQNAYGPGAHKLVKFVNFTNEQLKSVIELELLASECMADGTDKTFFVEVMNGSGNVYTAEPVRVIWSVYNAKPQISFTADGHGTGSIVTIEGSAAELEQAGAGKLNINIQETEAFDEFNITQIDIVKANGAIAKTLAVNSRSIDTQVNITECMEADTIESFHLVVKNAIGQEFTTGSITVNWVNDSRPSISFSIYGHLEGSTVCIPQASLPGKEPKINVSAADPDNTDNDIISRVEILTTNGALLKTFNVLAQNSTSISINEEVTQYVEQGYNYFCIRVTNKGNKVYTTGGIYVHFGDLSGDEYY